MTLPGLAYFAMVGQWGKPGIDLPIGSMTAYATRKTVNDWEVARFVLPKAEGDKEDAKLTISLFKNGSGSEEDNIKRQLAAFEAPEGKEKVESKRSKVSVGGKESTLLDLRGTLLEKFPPFDPKAKVTKKDNYRLLYVISKGDNGEAYFKLTGPEKTVEKHEKEFTEFLKNFK